MVNPQLRFQGLLDFQNGGCGKKFLGPVVRKPINANPRLKVNRGFHFSV